jgi:hypothetical protein
MPVIEPPALAFEQSYSFVDYGLIRWQAEFSQAIAL